MPSDTIFQLVRNGGILKVREHFEKNCDQLFIRDRNGQTALHIAASEGLLEEASYLIECGSFVHVYDTAGRIPFHCAVRNNQIEMATYLLEMGSFPHMNTRSEDTALHLSIDNSLIDMSRWLISLGANLQYKNRDGDTPIHKAALCGSVPILQLLVDYSPKLEALDITGATPFHKAAAWGHLSAVQFLFKAGANIHHVNFRGDSTLHAAAMGGSIGVVKWLLLQGVSLAGENLSGQTAQDVARTDRIKDLLEQVRVDGLGVIYNRGKVPPEEVKAQEQEEARVKVLLREEYKEETNMHARLLLEKEVNMLNNEQCVLLSGQKKRKEVAAVTPTPWSSSTTEAEDPTSVPEEETKEHEREGNGEVDEVLESLMERHRLSAVPDSLASDLTDTGCRRSDDTFSDDTGVLDESLLSRNSSDYWNDRAGHYLKRMENFARKADLDSSSESEGEEEEKEKEKEKKEKEKEEMKEPEVAEGKGVLAESQEEPFQELPENEEQKKEEQEVEQVVLMQKKEDEDEQQKSNEQEEEEEYEHQDEDDELTAVDDFRGGVLGEESDSNSDSDQEESSLDAVRLPHMEVSLLSLPEEEEGEGEDVDSDRTVEGSICEDGDEDEDEDEEEKKSERRLRELQREELLELISQQEDMLRELRMAQQKEVNEALQGLSSSPLSPEASGDQGVVALRATLDEKHSALLARLWSDHQTTLVAMRETHKFEQLSFAFEYGNDAGARDEVVGVEVESEQEICVAQPVQMLEQVLEEGEGEVLEEDEEEAVEEEGEEMVTAEAETPAPSSPAVVRKVGSGRLSKSPQATGRTNLRLLASGKLAAGLGRSALASLLGGDSGSESESDSCSAGGSSGEFFTSEEEGDEEEVEEGSEELVISSPSKHALSSDLALEVVSPSSVPASSPSPELKEETLQIEDFVPEASSQELVVAAEEIKENSGAEEKGSLLLLDAHQEEIEANSVHESAESPGLEVVTGGVEISPQKLRSSTGSRGNQRLMATGHLAAGLGSTVMSSFMCCSDSDLSSHSSSSSSGRFLSGSSSGSLSSQSADRSIAGSVDGGREEASPYKVSTSYDPPGTPPSYAHHPLSPSSLGSHDSDESFDSDASALSEKEKIAQLEANIVELRMLLKESGVSPSGLGATATPSSGFRRGSGREEGGDSCSTVEREKQLVAAESKKVFELIDLNGDGILSKLELVKGLRSRDSRLDLPALLDLPAVIRQEDGSRDHFMAVFHAMDKDGSSDISLSEFVQFCLEVHEQARSNGPVITSGGADSDCEGKETDEVGTLRAAAGQAMQSTVDMLKKVMQDGDLSPTPVKAKDTTQSSSLTPLRATATTAAALSGAHALAEKLRLLATYLLTESRASTLRDIADRVSVLADEAERGEGEQTEELIGACRSWRAEALGEVRGEIQSLEERVSQIYTAFLE